MENNENSWDIRLTRASVRTTIKQTWMLYLLTCSDKGRKRATIYGTCARRVRYLFASTSMLMNVFLRFQLPDILDFEVER